jgi:glycosyltransferase involved in cell wall biosynthesis
VFGRTGSTAKKAAHTVNRAGSRKQLLYFAVCDPDLQVTGATVRMGAFVKHLSKFYDITLVNMSGSGYRVSPDIEKLARNSEVSVVLRRSTVEFSQTGYFLFSRSLYEVANRYLESGCYDYLLADYGLAAVYGVMLARRHGIPLIYSSHNIEFQKYLEQSKTDVRRALLAPYVWWAERAACRQAKLIVAISESDRAQYARWVDPAKVEVIPQGFDAEAWNPFYAPPPMCPSVVLFFGNLRLEHNLGAARHIINEIVPTVTRLRRDVKFQLVGADPPPSLQVCDIECAGFVQDLGPYLRRANLVIAPMPFGFGMSTKLVTALAFGKRVLATPQALGAIPKRYSGLTVAPLEQFPEKILELLAAPPEPDAESFAALCNDFAWPVVIKRLYERIEERCGRPMVTANPTKDVAKFNHTSIGEASWR